VVRYSVCFFELGCKLGCFGRWYTVLNRRVEDDFTWPRVTHCRQGCEEALFAELEQITKRTTMKLSATTGRPS
jgi:hypothetical protein